MKRSDQMILAVVGVLGVLAAFWFLVLAPKRQEAADLGDKVTQLEASADEQEQLAATAEQAQSGYDENYHRVVVLGKAVPEDADTPSLLVELQRIADHADVEFQTIELAEGSDAAAVEAAQVTTPPPLTAPGDTGSESTTASSDTSSTGDTTTTDATSSTSTTTADPATSATSESSATTSTATSTSAAPPTEASAASLPIGATVGPAGLPVMPYDLSFSGGFFEVADFLADLDKLVDAGGSKARVAGRLMTVDGFSLSPVEDASGASNGNPVLDVSLAVTTYLTPAEQGLVAGATPGAPAPTTPATPTTNPESATTDTTATTATTP